MDNLVEFPKIDEHTIRCSVCKIRPAKFLCDYEDGLIFDALNEKGIKVPVQKGYCSMPLCDKCTHKVNRKDYCPVHFEDLKKELKV